LEHFENTWSISKGYLFGVTGELSGCLENVHLSFVVVPYSWLLTLCFFVSFLYQYSTSILSYLVPECSKDCTVENLEATVAEPVVELPEWVVNSLVAIKSGNVELCQTGVGGTYFVVVAGQQIAVFKPVDEEPGAPNNPKKSLSKPLLPWGTGAAREVAAFILDKGFSGVPETYIVEAINSEGVTVKGSLQKYIENEGDCSSMGSSRFSVDCVHRIGILDLRILNMDRNDENILVQKTNSGEYKLIPIDHAYSVTDKVDTYFTWMYWNQAKKSFSQEILSYISSIDAVSDSQILFNLGIDEASIRAVTVSTLLLQKAAEDGYNLFEIACMMSRVNVRNQCDFEIILSLLSMQTQPEQSNVLSQTFCERMADLKRSAVGIIDKYLEEKKR